MRTQTLRENGKLKVPSRKGRAGSMGRRPVGLGSGSSGSIGDSAAPGGSSARGGGAGGRPFRPFSSQPTSAISFVRPRHHVDLRPRRRHRRNHRRRAAIGANQLARRLDRPWRASACGKANTPPPRSLVPPPELPRVAPGLRGQRVFADLLGRTTRLLRRLFRRAASRRSPCRNRDRSLAGQSGFPRDASALAYRADHKNGRRRCSRRSEPPRLQRIFFDLRVGPRVVRHVEHGLAIGTPASACPPATPAP